MRLSLASTALLLLAGAAPMASAQDAVTAWQVRAACLNPHAARWVGNVNPKLQYLCSSLDVPILGRRLKAPEMAPWLAAAADPGKVPSPGQVAAYALSAVAAADTMARQIAAAQSSSPRALSGGTFASELDGPGNGILFDPSSASLRSADSIGVRRMAETIRAHLEASAHDTVTIFGHADGTGDPVVNLVLAQRRAAALLEALMHADPSLDVKRIQARAVVGPPALTDAQ
jgi:outer membrane protein OmpA-like peptidoglycan-associated protein